MPRSNTIKKMMRSNRGRVVGREKYGYTLLCNSPLASVSNWASQTVSAGVCTQGWTQQQQRTKAHKRTHTRTATKFPPASRYKKRGEEMEAKGLSLPLICWGNVGHRSWRKREGEKGVVGTVFSPCNILGEQTIERFAFSEKYSRETIAVRYFTFSVYGAQSIVIGLSPSFPVSVSPPPSQISHSPYLSRVCTYIDILSEKYLSRGKRSAGSAHAAKLGGGGSAAGLPTSSVKKSPNAKTGAFFQNF